MRPNCTLHRTAPTGPGRRGADVAGDVQTERPHHLDGPANEVFNPLALVFTESVSSKLPGVYFYPQSHIRSSDVLDFR